MESVMKQIKDLSDKAVKYDNMREKYTAYASKLLQAEKLIKEVVSELDPISAVKRHEATGINYGEIAAEIYEKMQQGLEVGTRLLTNSYKELDEKKANYILGQIRLHYKDVESRKEGKCVLIYCRKEHK